MFVIFHDHFFIFLHISHILWFFHHAWVYSRFSLAWNLIVSAKFYSYSIEKGLFRIFRSLFHTEPPWKWYSYILSAANLGLFSSHQFASGHSSSWIFYIPLDLMSGIDILFDLAFIGFRHYNWIQKRKLFYFKALYSWQRTDAFFQKHRW